MQATRKPARQVPPWRARWLAALYGVTLTLVTVAIWSDYLDSDPAERGANIGGAMMWMAVILPTTPLWIALSAALSGLLTDVEAVALSCCYAAVQLRLAYWWASWIDRKYAVANAAPGKGLRGDAPWRLSLHIYAFALPILVGCPLLLWWLALSMPIM